MRPTSRGEELTALLADPEIRAIVDVLEDEERPVPVEELAERLVRRGATVVESEVYEADLERTALALHHDRLPRLADVGLIEYDPGSNVASMRTLPWADVDWQDGTGVPSLLARLASDGDAEGEAIGVLEGRESVIRYGRRLADEAETELFCLYVSTDLLEDECVRRAEGAIDRGVTLYLGSGNQSVRDLARDRLPEATIWEPQLDWQNSRTSPRLGRLVLADRRHVMLAVLDEPSADGADPAETAVVGEGEGNPLVVLVRELLGSRLDHLDYQSADFRSELPT